MRENEEKTVATSTTTRMLLVITNETEKGDLPTNGYQIDLKLLK